MESEPDGCTYVKGKGMKGEAERVGCISQQFIQLGLKRFLEQID